MMKNQKTTILLLAALLANGANAQWFAEGSLGVVDTEATIEGIDVSGDDTYFRLAGGYQVSDMISVQGGFWDLGEIEEQAFGFTGTASADGVFGAVTFSATGVEQVNLYGRVGLYLWDAELCLDGRCDDDDGTDIFFGGGVGFDVGAGDLNLEIHFMELDEFDVTTYGLAYSIPLNP